MTFLFIFIIGLAFGSFFNVLIDRLPNEKSINGRSHCDYCKKTLGTFDLIPVLSFLVLSGKCRYCHKKLSVQYPLIELLTGGLFLIIFMVFIQTHSLNYANIALLFSYLGLYSVLLVIFFADVKYHIIPDSTQFFFFVFSVAILYFSKSIRTFENLGENFLFALAVMSPILLIYLLTKGKGMGFGDVKLAFTIGFFLKLGGFIALYIAFIIGAVIGVVLIIKGKSKMKSKIAFGPFLVIGVIFFLLLSDKILAFTKRIFGY